MHPARVLIVECDRCHRPVAEIGQHGQLLSNIRALGVLSFSAIHLPGGRRPSARWAAQVWDADPTTAARGEVPALGRIKLVCVHRRGPRSEQPVTRASLKRAVDRALAAGRNRIGMREIR